MLYPSKYSTLLVGLVALVGLVKSAPLARGESTLAQRMCDPQGNMCERPCSAYQLYHLQVDGGSKVPSFDTSTDAIYKRSSKETKVPISKDTDTKKKYPKEKAPSPNITIGRGKDAGGGSQSKETIENTEKNKNL